MTFWGLHILTVGYVVLATTSIATAMWIRHLVGIDVPGWRYLYISLILFVLWHITSLAERWIGTPMIILLGLKFLHPAVAICAVTFMFKGMKFFSNAR